MTAAQDFAAAQDAWRAAERAVAVTGLSVIAEALGRYPQVTHMEVDVTDQDMSGSLMLQGLRADNVELIQEDVDYVDDEVRDALGWLDDRNKGVWRPLPTDPDSANARSNATMIFDVARIRAAATASTAGPFEALIADARAWQAQRTEIAEAEAEGRDVVIFGTDSTSSVTAAYPDSDDTAVDIVQRLAEAVSTSTPVLDGIVDATAKFMVAVYAGDPEAADQYATTLVGLLPDDLLPDGLMATPLTAFASDRDRELIGWVDGEQFKPVSPDESPDDGPPTWTPVFG